MRPKASLPFHAIPICPTASVPRNTKSSLNKKNPRLYRFPLFTPNIFSTYLPVFQFISPFPQFLLSFPRFTQQFPDIPQPFPSLHHRFPDTYLHAVSEHLSDVQAGDGVILLQRAETRAGAVVGLAVTAAARLV